jgi:hypothetical protein
MKQQEVFKKIGVIIKELNEQYEYLQTTAENLNDLELELFVANTHFLTDHAEILRKLNLQKSQLQHALPQYTEQKQPEPQSTPQEEPRYFEPVVQQVKPAAERSPFVPEFTKPAQPDPIQFEITPPAQEQPVPQIDLHLNSETDSYSYIREEPETIRHDLILDEADWDEEDDAPLTEEEALITPEVELDQIEDETEEPNIVPTNPEPVIDNTPKTSAAQIEPVKEMPLKEEPVLTLNQKMSAQLKGVQGLYNQPAEQPIKDIKAVISLNDKLLFVKDLFNGYSLAYSEAIEIVNRFTSFEEADRFLKTNYVTKNNWESKKATADKFYALLKRRYA